MHASFASCCRLARAYSGVKCSRPPTARRCRDALQFNWRVCVCVCVTRVWSGRRWPLSNVCTVIHTQECARGAGEQDRERLSRIATTFKVHTFKATANCETTPHTHTHTRGVDVPVYAVMLQTSPSTTQCNLARLRRSCNDLPTLCSDYSSACNALMTATIESTHTHTTLLLHCSALCS